MTVEPISGRPCSDNKGRKDPGCRAPHQGADLPGLSVRTQKPRALVVDDETESLDLLERILHKSYDVHKADSPIDAIDLLAKHEYAVIISDQRMPEMSGAELLAEARERAPEAIRIVVTGYSEMESAVDAINHGSVSGFVLKPFDQQEIETAIAQAAMMRNRTVRRSELMAQMKERADQLDRANQELEERARAVQASEDNLRRVLEHMPDPICLVRDIQVVFVNRALVTYLGYQSEEEVLGRPVVGVMRAKDPGTLEQRLEAARNNGDSERPWEQQLARTDGASLVATFRALPIVSEESASLLVVVSDETEKRHMQAS
ncbi:response regulator, partial [Myxococcota bacterium]